MRYIEWLFLLVIGACGTGLANFIGYDVGFMESLPGLAVLVIISCLELFRSKGDPSQLPHCCHSAHWSSGRLSFISGKDFRSMLCVVLH